MRNYDEAILRGRRIVRKAPFPTAHQALRITLYDEFAARAFFGKAVEAYGPREPFAASLKAAEARIATLARQCRRHGVASPLDPFPQETSLAPGWRANCERALAGTLGRLQLYESLISRTDAGLRKSLRRLQAEDARQLQVWHDAVAEALRLEELHAQGGVAPDEAHMEHGVLGDFLERTFSVLSGQHAAIGVVGPLLGKLNPALLAGIAAGGAGVLLARGKRNFTQDGKEG
ncbi:ferritin [Aromatoleum toluclasticum]|uniref:ferritin n=1 Tax=Aromatoleum toluclasticum TaxID=92003 RepID=UPI001D17FEBA|nr:ferritin [Aromatoleum toluclasticum]MCC4117512.1 ferritin [Aromatoleum toluclasticum]